MTRTRFAWQGILNWFNFLVAPWSDSIRSSFSSNCWTRSIRQIDLSSPSVSGTDSTSRANETTGVKKTHIIFFCPIVSCNGLMSPVSCPWLRFLRGDSEDIVNFGNVKPATSGASTTATWTRFYTRCDFTGITHQQSQNKTRRVCILGHGRCSVAISFCRFPSVARKIHEWADCVLPSNNGHWPHQS